MRTLLVASVLLACTGIATAQLRTSGHDRKCKDLDTSQYGPAEVLPHCPPKTPNGTDPRVKEIVETTITVIFECDKNPWNKLMPEQQKLFTSGAYVNASQVSVEVLKALNLVEKPSSHKDKNKPSSHKHEKKPEKKPESHKKEDKPTSQKHEGKQNDKKSDNGDWSSADYKTKSPVSGLLAILYLEEFELWLIRAKTPEDLNDIIVRVSHVEGVKTIIRDSYMDPTGRNTPTAENTAATLRHMLQATSNDPLLPLQYHLPLTETTSAWEIIRGSKGVIVAVLDTGCDVNHPDLANNLWVNPGEVAGDGIDNDNNGIVDDVHGGTFIDDTATGDLTDNNGHGTHVTGIVGAEGNNGRGVSGVMPTASLLCLKYAEGPNGPLSAASRGYQYAIRRGARIINNSWKAIGPTAEGLFLRGSDDFAAQTLLFTPILQRVQAAGVINIWSAGNTDPGTDLDGSPTRSPMTALAAARGTPGPVNLQLVVVNTDQEDNKVASSDFGVETTDLAAPGNLILSTVPTNPSDDFTNPDTGAPKACGDTPEDECTVGRGLYGYLTGTSMAAPVVAGAAGLCLSVLEPCHRADDTQIAYDCILSTVDKKPQLTDVTRTGGRVNVKRTVECCAQFCSKTANPLKPEHTLPLLPVPGANPVTLPPLPVPGVSSVTVPVTKPEKVPGVHPAVTAEAGKPAATSPSGLLGLVTSIFGGRR